MKFPVGDGFVAGAMLSGSVYFARFLVDFLQLLLGSPPDGRKTWAIVITTEPRATVVGSSRVKRKDPSKISWIYG